MKLNPKNLTLFSLSRFARSLSLLAIVGLANLCTVNVAAAQLFQRDSDQAEKSNDENAPNADAVNNIFGIDGSAEPIEQQVDPDGWEILEPQDSKLAFRMPMKPRYVERSFSPILDRDPIIVRMHIATESKERSSVLSYHDLHDQPSTPREIKEILEGAVKGNVARVLGRLDDIKEIKVDGFPGREFSFSYTQDKVIHHAFARVVLAGVRQTQITVLYSEGAVDGAFTEKLLNSLVVKEAVTDPHFIPRTAQGK